MVTLNVIHELTVAHEDKIWKIRGLLGASIAMSSRESLIRLNLSFSPTNDWELLNYFSVGDYVQFSLGYADRGCPPLTELFNGKVKSIEPGTPINIACLCGYEEIRNRKISKTYTNQSYLQIATDIVEQMGYRIATQPDLELYMTPPQHYRIDQKTLEQAMNDLCNECFAEWYPIGGGEVWFGEKDVTRPVYGETPVFILGRNVFAEVSKINLKKQTDIHKVIAKVYDADNEKEITLGVYQDANYTEGQRVISCTAKVGNPNQVMANQLAKRYYDRSLHGFKGNLTVIGDPRVVKGGTVKIYLSKEDRLAGYGYNVTVKGVHHYYGEGGFTQGLYTTTFDFVGSSNWIN